MMNSSNLHVESHCNERVKDVQAIIDKLSSCETKSGHLKRKTSSFRRYHRPHISSKKTILNSSNSKRKKRVKMDCRRIRRRLMFQSNTDKPVLLHKIHFRAKSLQKDGCDRLESHVWHAKRMIMKKLHGSFVLPIRNRSFSLPYFRRVLKCGTVLHDMSYHCHMELRGLRSDLIDSLQHHMVKYSIIIIIENSQCSYVGYE